MSNWLGSIRLDKARIAKELGLQWSTDLCQVPTCTKPVTWDIWFMSCQGEPDYVCDEHLVSSLKQRFAIGEVAEVVRVRV